MTITAPRIYNLFPLLAGEMATWDRHLPRIRDMGFDWVYLNPFHYPGFSGSLYAVKDPYGLHDIVRGDDKRPTDEIVAGFFRAAHDHGLKVMMDLVVNHTSRDALLVEDHPEWYLRDVDGSLYSPRAVNPADPNDVTVWGDLAELDFETPAHRDGLVGYWSEYMVHYLTLGVDGFRCDAAYQVPAEAWRPMIEAARGTRRDVQFFAETLGCSVDAIRALASAGFDYIFNSSKYWDFRGRWLLDQYAETRRIAPSISFPESHDTPRMAAETVDLDVAEAAAVARQRYLFSASFSSGVMMPMGYEFGFTRPLHVVESRPDQWEGGRYDISGFIAEVNATRATIAALNVEGAQRAVTAPHAPVLGLYRDGPADVAGSGAILLINRDPHAAHPIDPGQVVAALPGLHSGIVDRTPDSSEKPLVPGADLVLEPQEIRLYEAAARGRIRPARTRRASETRLQRLAGNRVAIETVWPEIDGGRFPIKRVVGDTVEVSADIFADGHDGIAACIQYKPKGERAWSEAPMAFVDNDRWSGRFPVTRNCRYVYTIAAWRDLFSSWRKDFVKKRDAGQAVDLELIEGRRLLENAGVKAREADPASDDARRLGQVLDRLAQHEGDSVVQAGILLSGDVHELMQRAAPRTNLSRYEAELEVIVDRRAAQFAAWYELFPRSAHNDGRTHGTFDDVIAQLPRVSAMGFDVLYFPPIHPIGLTNRKGRNNSLTPAADDPGSPYAIGSADGGHTAIHPELGTEEDFERLVAAARDYGLEIALDFAIQCSPDHPWIKQHPEWFDWRPDGTIKFAENPPKRYEDIVNVHFYRDALPSLWYELRDVVQYWIDRGVKIFRVDNPHTKPLPFWEWMIEELTARHPDVIFLSEAFTRPKMMKRLAKVGFTQSYSYFTWRNTKAELSEYLTELTREACAEYMRPNFFVNTPDINPHFLQSGKRGAYMIRAALAATLSTLWGVYNGFELCEGRAVAGKEEYLDSEKYQLRAWDWDRPGNIRDYITRLNHIRQENPALQGFTNLEFHPAHNDTILFFSKMTEVRDNIILVAVSLDPDHVQEGWIELPFHRLGLPDHAGVEVDSLFTGEVWEWHGRGQHVGFNPEINPAAIWRITPPHLRR